MKYLFPSHYASEWRRYRPINASNAGHRFERHKSCRKGRVGKVQRLPSQSVRKVTSSRSMTQTSANEVNLTASILNPWCNPLSSYSDSSTYILPGGPHATPIHGSDPLNKERLASSPGYYEAGSNNCESASSTLLGCQKNLGVENGQTFDNRYSADPVPFIDSDITQDDQLPISPHIVASIITQSQVPNTSKMRDTTIPDSSKEADATTVAETRILRSSNALSIRSIQRRLGGKFGADSVSHIHSVLCYSSSNSSS